MNDLTSDPDCDGLRRALLVALSAALMLVACDKEHPGQGQVTSSDLAALKRLIKLPAQVSRADWQTGAQAEHGSDWWLAAVLDVPADAMPKVLADPGTPGTLDTPPGMQPTASFAQLEALPGATPTAGGALAPGGRAARHRTLRQLAAAARQRDAAVAHPGVRAALDELTCPAPPNPVLNRSRPPARMADSSRGGQGP